jgi:hypothetical protein
MRWLWGRKPSKHTKPILHTRCLIDTMPNYSSFRNAKYRHRMPFLYNSWHLAMICIMETQTDSDIPVFFRPKNLIYTPTNHPKVTLFFVFLCLFFYVYVFFTCIVAYYLLGKKRMCTCMCDVQSNVQAQELSKCSYVCMFI